MRVRSIDPPFRDYRDIGIALLEPTNPDIEVSFRQMAASGSSTPNATAQ